MPALAQRNAQVSEAIRWCGLSVGWAAIAGITAIIAGFAAGAVALVAFGADSITDGSASAVLVWRFRSERSIEHDLDRSEHRAAQAVGAVLILIAIYISASAIAALAGHSTPNRPQLPRAHRRLCLGAARARPRQAPPRGAAPERRSAWRRHPQPRRRRLGRRHTSQPRARRSPRLVVVRLCRCAHHRQLSAERRLENQPRRPPPTRRLSEAVRPRHAGSQKSGSTPPALLARPTPSCPNDGVRRGSQLTDAATRSRTRGRTCSL